MLALELGIFHLQVLQKFLLVVLILLAPATVRAQAFCEWPYETEVTVTENSGTTQTTYQVAMDIVAADLNPDYLWSSDGSDLRVVDTDGSTELDFFIEDWDAGAQTARVWVLFPTLVANSNRVISLYYGNTSAPGLSTGFTFTNPGIRFHTRNSNITPASKAQAFNEFNSQNDSVPGYGCTSITNFTGVTNQNQFSPPALNGDFVALSESFFEVTPAEEGVWGFRYGADFGRGGALYVDDVELEQQWGDNLWWAGNWGASTQVLEGTINLTAGYHKLEIIGFEDCCDGGITVQYQRPGGTFQTFETSTIDVRSRDCPVADSSFAYGLQNLQAPDLVIAKTNQVMEDPVNGVVNPKAIPGARVRYSMTVTNQGIGAVDEESIDISDSIPADTSLYVQGSAPFVFADGAIPSGVSLDYLGLSDPTDDVTFFDTNGASYSPAAGLNGADGEVTEIRFTPSGRMNCGDAVNAPSFTTSFDVILE